MKYVITTFCMFFLLVGEALSEYRFPLQVDFVLVRSTGQMGATIIGKRSSIEVTSIQLNDSTCGSTAYSTSALPINLKHGESFKIMSQVGCKFKEMHVVTSEGEFIFVVHLPK